MTAPGWLVDQRQAATLDLVLHWPTLAHLGELAPVRPQAWPLWLLDAVKVHDAVLRTDARGCEHLAGRGPLPACTSPVKTPGRMWCTGCAEQVIASILGEDERCDACAAPSTYSVAVPRGNVLNFVFVCPPCRQDLIPDGDL